MNLSNENKLILSCTRAESQVDQIENLVSLPLNWDKVLESAFSRGIAPFVYNSLKRIREKRHVPQRVMDTLKKAYHENTARNMYLYAELLRILRAFNDKGVKAILLKGAALARFIYGDIGLRPMTDIDLLVRREDVSCAKRIMMGLDYSPEMDALSWEWYEKNHHHLTPYVNRKTSLAVEIHWHIISKSFNLDIDKWFDRAKSREIDGYEILIPSPEDMILHLCFHMYNHGYDTEMILRELRDMAQILDHFKGQIDWKLFQDEINDYELQRPVYSILYLTRKVFGSVGLPWQGAELPNTDIDLKLVNILEKRMYGKENIFSSIPGGLIKSLVVDKVQNKIKLLLPIIFPTREVVTRRYSPRSFSSMLYFYYFVRPFRLIARYGKYLLVINHTQRGD